MRCQFSPDAVRRASDPVVAYEGELEEIGSVCRISLFNACQWYLFHENSRFTDMRGPGRSTDTNTERLSSLEEHPNLRIIKSSEHVRYPPGLTITSHHCFTLGQCPD